MLEVLEEVTSRMKIWLETQESVIKFVHKANELPTSIILNVVDEKGMCVSARSVLGVLYAQEFKHMWLVSNSDRIHTVFSEFAKD